MGVHDDFPWFLTSFDHQISGSDRLPVVLSTYQRYCDILAPPKKYKVDLTNVFFGATTGCDVMIC